MLVYVRPSNEALLRARVPGAQDQRGCPSDLRSFLSSQGGLVNPRLRTSDKTLQMFHFPPLPLRGVAQVALYCAHRTSTFL
jgi:hypothetical protein